MLPLRSVSDPVTVRHPGGLLHGFLVLRDSTDNVIAEGDLSQTVRGTRVTSELIFHFKDGSLYREDVVYSQRHFFQLLKYQLACRGKSFKHPMEMSIDSSSGSVSVIETNDDGKSKTYAEQMKLPGDLANGMVTTVLLDVSPVTPKTTLSMVVATPKPRLVKLIVTPGAEDSFVVSGVKRKSASFRIKIDIGGVSGMIAPLVGKQPPDIHVWILEGKAPGFLRSEGPLVADGPVWQIELASPEWHKSQ